MGTKRYVIAPRPSARPVPEDWQERIAAIGGVSGMAAMPGRIQLYATEEAIERIREEFGDAFRIEETVGREPLG